WESGGGAGRPPPGRLWRDIYGRGTVRRLSCPCSTSPAQGKAAVERRRRRVVDDVRAHAQQVRVQVRVADPHLQIPNERERRTWRRQPEEVASAALQPHLRNEEVVIGRQIDWGAEHQADPEFVPPHRPTRLTA